jgi:phosphopantothenoylcysteine synthetase/decarboxylase
VQALKRLIRCRGDLASKLTKQDRSVHVVMTASATQFVTPLTLQTLSRHPVTANILRRKDELASGAYRACR